MDLYRAAPPSSGRTQVKTRSYRDDQPRSSDYGGTGLDRRRGTAEFSWDSLSQCSSSLTSPYCASGSFSLFRMSGGQRCPIFSWHSVPLSCLLPHTSCFFQQIAGASKGVLFGTLFAFFTEEETPCDPGPPRCSS